MASGSSALKRAITDDDVDRVHRIITDALRTWRHRHLLAQGLSTSCELENRFRIVQRLVALGADLTTNFGNRPPPLIIAVQLDRREIVKLLLESDCRNGTLLKKTLLKAALLDAKSKPVGELLIEHGADINFLEKGNKSVLMNARNSEIVKLLIEKGLDVEAKDSDGRTALMNTLINHKDPAIANTLMEYGRADINATDNKGRTILMTAIWKSRIEVLTTLLKEGADVRVTDNRGRNALHHLASDKKRTYPYRADRKKGKKEEQLEHDSRILQILLGTGVDPKMTDNNGRTCLHWAASFGCSGLLKLLLQTGKFDVNAVERRSRTPLHFAAANGHFKAVEILLDEQNIDIDIASDGDWTALHCACWADWAEKGIDLSVPAVKKILEHGASVHKKLESGRTPLHVAAEAGNLAIVRFLLEVTDVKRTSRDALGNTPLLSGAKAQHKNRDEIVGLFAPWKNLHTLSPDAQAAAKSFSATIVDFPEHRKPKGPERPSVFDLLYGKHPDSANKPKVIAFDKTSVGSQGFRWIHLPANNVSWCLDLFAKYFIEEGAVDWNSFRALERSFNHQHRGHEPQARYMTPLCQTVIRPWGNEEGGGTYEGEAKEGPFSRSSTFYVRTEQPISRPASPEIAQVSSPQVVMSPTELKRFDFPKAKASKSRRRPTFARKGGSDSIDDSGPVSDFFVFMPYLHFDTYQEREEMSDSYDRILYGSLPAPGPVEKLERLQKDPKLQRNSKANQGASGEASKLPSEKDHSLFRAHLKKTSDQALHIPRTLDQSFYHHINTRERDTDQVIHRFQKKFHHPCPNPKVLMVHQLWLYVIGKKLVVTSFPQRWKQPKKDPLNVLESILAIINSPNREPVRSVYELAMIISGRCFGAYDRHGVGSDDAQFLDMFEGWIGAAMDDEVKLFRRFKRDSANASELLQTDIAFRDVERTLRRRDQPEAREAEKFTIITPRSSKSSGFMENLLDIGYETELLGEIKDIQDELNMLSVVFKHQEQVLPGIKETIKNISRQENWSQAIQQDVRKAFDDHMRTISHPQRDIQRMERQAKRMYNSIRDLLDLKQKHANAIEARYAREQQNDTSKQGQTLMIFTIFTVIFLPLSFVAALFAIDIDELPHRDGIQVLSAGFVAKYTFGIGLAIAILFVLITVYVRDIPYGIGLIRDRWQGNKKRASQSNQAIPEGSKRTTGEHQHEVRSTSRNLHSPIRHREAKLEDLESGGSNHYRDA